MSLKRQGVYSSLTFQGIYFSMILNWTSGWVASFLINTITLWVCKPLTVQPDCLKGRVVCGTIYEDMHLKELLGSIARVGTWVLYPGLGFLSSATWHLLPNKHYDGLINQSLAHLDPGFCQVDSHSEVFSCEHIWVVRLRKGFFQFLELQKTSSQNYESE